MGERCNDPVVPWTVHLERILVRIIGTIIKMIGNHRTVACLAGEKEIVPKAEQIIVGLSGEKIVLQSKKIR